MGLLYGREMASRIETASFTAAGQTTDGVEMQGPFLMMATGGVGTVELQFSVDGGTTWITAQLPNGANNSWAVPVNQIVPNLLNESGILHRLRCSSFTSGPIAIRLSSGGPT